MRRILAAMGLRRPQPASRENLARLVAVVAVLAGLVLLHSPVCTGGMTPGASMVIPTSSTALSSTALSSTVPSSTSMSMMAGLAMAADQTSGHGSAMAGHHPAGSYGFTGADAPDRVREAGRGDLGGVLAACLMFIVAALVALATLARPGRSKISAPPPFCGPVLALAPRRVLGPDLARLCILRT